MLSLDSILILEMIQAKYQSWADFISWKHLHLLAMFSRTYHLEV